MMAAALETTFSSIRTSARAWSPPHLCARAHVNACSGGCGGGASASSPCWRRTATIAVAALVLVGTVIGCWQGVSATAIVNAEELMQCDEDQTISSHFSPQQDEGLPTHGDFDGKLRSRLFWLHGGSREQLTKARLHLYDAIVLANRFNRTVVLPNVGNSMMGLDLALPFCTYFDVHSVSSLTEWVTLDAFLKAQLSQMRAMLLFVSRPETGCSTNVTIFLEKVRSTLARLSASTASQWHWDWRCEQMPLEAVPGSVHVPASDLARVLRVLHGITTSTALDTRISISSSSSSSSSRGNSNEDAEGAVRWSEAGEIAATSHSASVTSSDASSSSVRRSNVAVVPAQLVLDFRETPLILLPHSAREAPFSTAFAPHLHRAVDRLATHMSSGGGGGGAFVAVHWRFEKLKGGERLVGCARKLVASVRRLKKQNPKLQSLFLATDVNADGTSPSSSFNLSSHPHGRAIVQTRKMLQEMLKPVTWASVVDGWPLVDTGVQSILDKLMCMRALIFLYAPKRCGAGLGSFTVEIIRSRHRMQQQLQDQQQLQQQLQMHSKTESDAPAFFTTRWDQPLQWQ